MQPDDKKQFITAWSTMMELQAGKELSDRGLRLAFDLLAEYELFEVKQAMRIHCKKSVFHAKPADIVQIIKGEIPSNAELFGLAQANDTILGSYINQSVGDHDIRRLTPRDATARVASIRRSVEAFVERVQSGMMHNDEIMIYGGKGYDITGELCPNLPGARVVYHERLKARSEDLVKAQLPSDAATAPTQPPKERTEADTVAGKQTLAKLMSEMGLKTMVVES